MREVRISAFNPCICIKCNLSQQVVRDLHKVPRGTVSRVRGSDLIVGKDVPVVMGP